MAALQYLLVATAGLSLAFILAWAACRRVDNYGFVDAAWAFSFAVVGVCFAWLGPGWAPRKVVLAAMAAAWSLRLGAHLFIRLLRHHPFEDGRYVQLRKDWGRQFGWKMFGFFQLQALSVAILCLPIALPMFDRAGGFHLLEILGLALWLIGIAGETISDAQLAAFKRVPANRGRVCAIGLWRYSRHPNYFCEWLIWVGFATFALSAPHGWLGLISPGVILYLLLRVTGIPLAEEQSLRSKGDAYRRYQQTTSRFIPWFPKQRA